MQQGAVVRGIFGQAAQRVWLWNFQLQALAVEQPWERQEWRGRGKGPFCVVFARWWGACCFQISSNNKAHLLLQVH